MREPDGRPDALAERQGAPGKTLSAVPKETMAACTGKTAEPRWRASGDFLLRVIAGETVMVPVGTGPGQLNGMLTVNESFRFLWELFQTPHTVREAAQAVLERYDGTEEQVTKDINDFVAESRRLGFLTQEE